MNIQNPQQAPCYHRHFLAVPLLVAALGILLLTRSILMDDVATVGQSATALRTLDVQADAAQIYLFPSGLRAEITEGTQLREQWGTLQLFRGTAFVSGPASILLQAGDIRFQGFHGAFQVSESAFSGEITVYAASTPVLITQGSRQVLLPAGTQVTLTFDSHARAPVIPMPEQILRELLLRSGTDTLPLQAAFASPLERDLSEAAGKAPSTAAALIEQVQDPSLWLLLSFHPAYREAVWSVPGPRDITEAVRRKRWLLFVAPYTGQRTSLAIRQFGDEIRKFSRQDADAPAFVTQLLQAITDLRQSPDADAVETMEHLRQAVLGALADYPVADLGVAAQSQYAQLQQEEGIPAYSEPLADAASSSSVPAEEPAASDIPAPVAPSAETAAAIEARVREILSENGGLFTVQTTLRAVTDSTVAVQGLLYATTTGEHVYAFTFDLEAMEIRDIDRDKQLLPYYLPFDKFAAWAKSS